MTDLVERLRIYDPDVDSPDVVLEAADEIERLRRLVGHLTSATTILAEFKQVQDERISH